MRIARWPVLIAAAIWSSCAKKLEGPTPQVGSVTPAGVCRVQLDTTVEISGSGFSPLVTSSLTEGRRLELPLVELLRMKDIAGGEASDAPVAIPDDPSAPEDSQLRWHSQERMAFLVSEDLGLSAGLFDVRVTNRSGASHSLAGGLLAVPPPSVSTLSQDIACRDKSNSLGLSGDFFIRAGGASPTILLGATTFSPTSVEDCRALPGSGGFEACTKMSLDLAAQSLPAGAYTVVVTNPDPVGCKSIEGQLLTLFDKPTITNVSPLGICSQASSQQMVITGIGFLTVDGAPPTVKLGTQSFTPVPGGCTDVAGPKETVQSCTTLTITIATGTFQPGNYPLTVQNPPPVDCASSDSFTLKVTAPPTITSVAPQTVCSGAATLTLTGTNFADGAKVTLGSPPNSVDAQTVTVSNGTTAVATFPAGIPTGGSFAVTLTNSDGCSATSTLTVTVIPGPQIFFVDPSIVYNGISTQATVYGTGFTGAVQAVSITPSAGGTPTSLAFTYDPQRPNQVQVIIPKSTPAGDYDMSLNDTTLCPAKLQNAVKVVNQATLALGTPPVVPAFGWVNEATPVTINGTAFAAVPRLYLNPVNPGPNTVATAVGAVTFLDPTRLTALVPTPKLAVGKYDLIVVNPDGLVGYAASAFEVTQLPPPTILSLSPGSVAATNPATFAIDGKDFRQPAVTLQCLDSTGTPLATSPIATVTGSTSTSAGVSFDASMAGVACVVRVTNGDNNTFADFSALVITNPAQNLYAAKSGPNLTVARRAPVVLGGNATAAARYLHVIGGDDGTGGAAMDSVESSALDLYGVPSAFFVQRPKLNQARALAAGTLVGRWLYVAGGSSGGTALDTVERAVVLDPALRGEVTDLLLEVSRTQGLGKGVWYYRVSAVMSASDPFNPNGENLASDPFPVQLPDLGATKFVVTVSWKSDPGAAKYRVYRSPTAGATVGTEQLIAEVNAQDTWFKDTGLAPIGADNPLPIGSTGKWQVLTPQLSSPREGAGVAWGADPSTPGKAYLYVFGGRTSATSALASYEFLELTLNANGSQAPAATFSTGSTNLGNARWQLGASRATSELSSRIGANQTYLYVLGGVAANGTNMVNTTEAGLVQAGGQLAFTSLQNLNRAGYATMVAGNYVFAFGGNGASPDATIVSGEICGPGVNACGPPANQVPPKVINWNTGQNMLETRYLFGGTLSGAFIYVAGGVTVAAPLTISKSTEYRLW